MSNENGEQQRLSVRVVPKGWDEYVNEERTMGLNPRLSRLREIARARLNFQGVVILRGLPQSEMAHPEFFYAQTSTNHDGAGHIIEYNREVPVEDSTFFHEFCHVKMNEVGFKEVQDKVNEQAGDCFDSEDLWREIAMARNSISEIYGNYLLYRFFERESESERDEEDCVYASTDGARSIVQKYGFDGIVYMASYRITRNWLGRDVRAFQMALKEAFDGTSALQTYGKLNSIMSKLPRVREAREIQRLTNVEIGSIVECVWNIFKLKTGRDWRDCW